MAGSRPSCGCSRSKARAPARSRPCSTATAPSACRSSRGGEARVEVAALRPLLGPAGGLQRAGGVLTLEPRPPHGKRSMNWISNVVRPKIRNYFVRRETPENLWIKCPETGQLVFYKDVE